MALVRWQATVQTENGVAVVTPTVTVRNVSDNSIATIYDDDGAAKVNPFTGTADGFVSFKALPGRYIIEGVKGGQEAPDWIVDLSSVNVDAMRTADALSGKQVLIAHRGFRSVFPENTMLAISAAAKHCDAVEIDVQVSADGSTYVFHDTTIDALTDGTGTFTALTDAYIDGLEFDAFGLDADLKSVIRIPRFEYVLNWARKNGAFLMPEIKSVRTDADVDLMCDQVLDANMPRWCVLSSFSWTHTLRALNYNDKIQCGYIGSSSVLADMQYAIDTLGPFGGRGWFLTVTDSIIANPSIVEYASMRGVPIVAYTIVSQETADAVMGLGVNMVISDTILTQGEKA